jgi:hypothetical protein
MSMNKEPQGKVITVILPKGKSPEILEALYDKGVARVAFAYARGFDIHDEENHKTGIPKATEKEIVTVIAKDAVEAEWIFDFIYENGGINELGGGIMYMSSLTGAVPFIMPDLPREEDNHKAHAAKAPEAQA